MRNGRLEFARVIFGGAMILETRFGVAVRAYSLQILEFPLGGVALGYLLGAAGLVSGLGLLLFRRVSREPPKP